MYVYTHRREASFSPCGESPPLDRRGTDPRLSFAYDTLDVSDEPRLRRSARQSVHLPTIGARLRRARRERRAKLTYPGLGATDYLLSPDLNGPLDVIWAGDEHAVLRAGDAITFPSRLRHKWKNVGRGTLTAIWAITPPSY